MDLSTFIARILGLYLLILSICIFISRGHIKSTISDVIKNDALQFILGLNIIVFGLLLVVSHNIWVASWQVGITILAWLILLKGILYAAFPQAIRNLSQPFLKSGTFPTMGIIINFLLGVYFCYYGFLAG